MGQSSKTPMVLDINDFRPPRLGGAPCVVTFMGFQFRTPEGQDHINVSVTVHDGDFARVIEAVKKQGGMYLPPLGEGGNVVSWFLPWPCAAVRISPAR
jgi:hypothetical protein